MRRALLVLAALAAPASLAAAQAAGPTGSLSLAGGSELGLDSGKAGVFELAATAGYDLGAMGLRPELGLVLGLAPDGNLALRPGVSWSVPGFPFRLRVAADASNARESSFGWRWLLLGGAAELRFTGRLAFEAGLDLGFPLARKAGVPVLFRAGTNLRF